MLPSLRLKKNEERRIKQGHVWVFSNEVDIQATPLKNFTAGQQVIIEAYNGKALGMGFVNPNTLICARILSRSPKLELNKKFLKKRIQEAEFLRETVFEKPYYRLVFGDSDGLPGLGWIVLVTYLPCKSPPQAWSWLRMTSCKYWIIYIIQRPL